ncbi:hypothetical protein SLEP1_g11513 [Rubroshorea leprosula]|uniref:mitogen-activated protein kinase kinase kinase n=1 Tax=Rubroshorea leprosula TaxID=152421 RepID=A0AAV5IHG0_9ROSI|nr:hypothetical protein SLEP1_g11513 [Rubroshorea leprosula]
MSIKTKMSVTNWSIKNEISIDNMSINEVRIKNIMDIESGVPTQSIYVSWFNGNNCFLEWKNGGISGSGSLYRADGNGCNVLCVGEWENGFISGRGELSRADGNGCKVACVGNWENGGLSGRGKLNWADGNGWKVPCVGEWEDGGISGRGVLYRADENSCKVLCVGERENGKISGRGALRRADGNGCKVLCIGEWENGGISGRGTLNWADGNGCKVRCLGEWENGGISGRGSLYRTDGDGGKVLCVGEWENGGISGRGSLYRTDGNGCKVLCVGEWENGGISSRGVLHFSDGNGCGPRIIGDWENVMISGPKGHGVFSWPDGNGVIAPSGRFKRNITCWEKVKPLGCGSFGSVYEGISGDGTFFAVKEVSLLDQGSRGKKRIAQLEQEIDILSQFEHENIVQYYGTEKGHGSKGSGVQTKQGFPAKIQWDKENYSKRKKEKNTVTIDGSFCALKEVSLLDQGSQREHSIVQLEQEIGLLSQFEHENIVQYYGTDRDESNLYIFLELITQGSLLSLYERCNLKDSQVSFYTRQILYALKFLHGKGVVHRDIKCANILVDQNGSVKLADFGSAKVTKLNDVNSFQGTAFWMAPEEILRTRESTSEYGG